MLQGKKTYVTKTRGGQLIVRKKFVVVNFLGSHAEFLNLVSYFENFKNNTQVVATRQTRCESGANKTSIYEKL